MRPSTAVGWYLFSIISDSLHRGLKSPRRAECQRRRDGGRGTPTVDGFPRGSRDSAYTLTSGTFGTVPRRGGVSSPRGPGGLRRGAARRFLARRGSGSFSARGFTGPSG